MSIRREDANATVVVPSRTTPQGVDQVVAQVGDLLDAFARMSGMDTWYLGRHTGAAVLPLAVSAEGTGVEVGVPLEWTGSVCRRMASRLGPTAASDIRDVPNYARAPLATAFGMGSYAGVPLLSSPDRLIGVIAGWGRRTATLPDGFAEMLRTTSMLIAPQFEQALRRDAERRAEVVTQIRQDFGELLTSVPSRRGWGALLRDAEQRAAWFGMTTGLLLVDVGPVRSTSQIQHAAGCVADVQRDQIVARLSSREVAVLAISEEVAHLPGMAAAVTKALRESGFDPTATWAERREAEDLPDAWMLAQRRLVELRRTPYSSPESSLVSSPVSSSGSSPMPMARAATRPTSRAELRAELRESSRRRGSGGRHRQRETVGAGS